MARVTEIERGRKRVWKIICWAIGILSMILVGSAVASLTGCTPPQAATANPAIQAGDIDHLQQQITQTQTENHALDAERRKLEQDRLRRQERQSLADKGILAGFLLVMAVAPAFIPERYRPLAYLIAVGVIFAAVFLPVIWPI